MESRESIADLEQKCGELIARAIDEGAEASFHAVREAMDVARSLGISASLTLAQAHLEDRIAAARREREKRTSRGPLIVRFKNLIGLG